jgi:aryl-alcohol dehydrogenase-like predicted oxidoreductase
VIRFDDVDRIFAEGGAMEAFEAARKAGKIRFIGFTGHKDPEVHLHMLRTAKAHGFRFDTVQMPLNLLDTHYRSFEKKVLPELVSSRIGVLGMKSMGAGVLLKSKTLTPSECLTYALSLPTLPWSEPSPLPSPQTGSTSCSRRRQPSIQPQAIPNG